MIGIFRHNNPISLLMLFIMAYAALFLKQDVVLVFTEQKHTLLLTNLMKWLNAWEGNYHLYTKIFKYIVLITEAFYLNKIGRDNKLLERSTHIHSMTFLLISFLIPFNITIFTLLINAFLLIAFDAFIKMYKKTNPFNNIILAGFMIAILSSITNNYLIFYGWVTVALLIIRPTSLREWTVLNIGFLLPYYFLISLLYLYDHLTLDAIIQFKSPLMSLPQLTPFVGAKLIMLIVLPFIGLMIGSSQINKMVLQNRKAYIVVFALLLASILINVMNLQQLSEYSFLLLLPASFLFAPFFQSFKKDFIPNLVLIVLIVMSYIR